MVLLEVWNMKQTSEFIYILESNRNYLPQKYDYISTFSV